MATKKEELATGCLSRVADDEPIFVLRAQDEIAAYVVRYWAGLYLLERGEDAKFREAMALADAMEAWPNRKGPD